MSWMTWASATGKPWAHIESERAIESAPPDTAISVGAWVGLSFRQVVAMDREAGSLRKASRVRSLALASLTQG